MNKEVRELAKRAQRDGWRTEITNSSHVKFVHPEASGPVYVSSTPSDHYAMKNAEGDLRRALREGRQDTEENGSSTAPPGAPTPASRSNPTPSTTPDSSDGSSTTSSPTKKQVGRPDNREKERKVGTLETQVWRHIKDRSTVTLDELEEELDLKRNQISNVMVRLRDKGRVRIVGKGFYEIDQGPWTETPEAEGPGNEEPPAPVAGAVFECVMEGRDGKLLLRDDNGEHWLAERLTR